MLKIQGYDDNTPAAIGWLNNAGLERSTSTKRNGTHSMSVNVSNTEYQYFPLGANYATLYMGFAFQVGSLTNRLRICSFQDGSTYQLCLTVETDGSLRLFRGLAGKFDGIGGATSLQQTSAGLITASAWHHLQIKATFHGSTGVYEVKLNSTVVLSGSSVNTSSSGNAYANRIGLGDVVPATGQFFDDFWVSDVAYQGDSVVETLYATANGTTNNYNVSGAASNFQAVDETGTMDDDTTYVYDANVGDIDLYAMGNLVHTTGTVKGFQVNAVMRKDDAGTREAAMVVRSSSTNSVRATIALTETYTRYSESFVTDPVTSVAPTIASVNALELGSKVIS